MVVICTITMVSHTFLVKTIIGYLRSKPPARQTPLDVVLIDMVIIVFMFVLNIIVGLLSPIFFGHLSQFVAHWMCCIKWFFSYYFFTAGAVTTIVRYLLVFHGPVLADINDHFVHLGTRFITLGIVICAYLIDLSLGIDGTFDIHYLTGTDPDLLE